MAYVMDQKSILLLQSTWQNNVRMSNLVEQIRGSLSSIRTLSKMLSVQIRKSEISYDIVQDILEQGDCLSDTLKGLQDAVSLTKANIMRYSEEKLKRMPKSTHPDHESVRSQFSDNLSQKLESFSSKSKDLEMPMPPIALAPLRQEGIRFGSHQTQEGQKDYLQGSLLLNSTTIPGDSGENPVRTYKASQNIW